MNSCRRVRFATALDNNIVIESRGGVDKWSMVWRRSFCCLTRALCSLLLNENAREINGLLIIFFFFLNFQTGLLDTITSTADSQDCPGVCVHTLATLICYEVLEDVPCPSSSMKCCVESSPANTTMAPATSTTTTTPRPSTTSKPRTTLAPKTTPKPTSNVEKQDNAVDSSAPDGKLVPCPTRHFPHRFHC